MIIETKVPADIREYKAKLLGPFTARQAICCAIAVAIDIPLGIALFHSTLGTRIMIYLIILIDVPILLMAMDMRGMPMFDYLRNIIFPNFARPAKRRNITKIAEHKEAKLTNKEINDRERREKAAAKKNPIYKSYK